MKTEKLSAFIVDDDPFYSNLIDNWLNYNYLANVKQFKTAEACYDHLSESPDIIFLDFNLLQEGEKNVNGDVALVNFLKMNPKLKIVMISSEKNDERKLKLLENGATDYFVKDDDTLHAMREVMNKIVNYKKYIKKYSNSQFTD